jgi:hypothetical protein
MATCAVWLALPRPVEPDVLPLPAVDRRALQRALEVESALAEMATSSPLSFEVRAIGELVRRYGLAVKAHDTGAAQGAKLELAALVSAVVPRLGSEPVRRLRALQAQLFLAAVERWQASGRTDRDIDELGGDFTEKCQSAGWLDAKGRLALSQAELSVQFRVRWTELAGRLDDADFRPSLDEFRLYFRTLLERPEPGAEVDERRLPIVLKLSHIDSEYPSALAAGVLFARLGRRDAARSAFAAHLEQRPNGPWAARARNYELAMLTAGGD